MRKAECRQGIVQWHVLAVGAIMLSGCARQAPPCTREPALTPLACAEKVLSCLESASTLDVFVLDYWNRPTPSEKTFRGFRVIGQTTVEDKERRDAIVLGLRRGFDEARAAGFPMYSSVASYSEGVLARAADGTPVVEIAFNFESGRSGAVFNDGISHAFPMGKSAQHSLVDILREAGIYPLSREPWQTRPQETPNPAVNPSGGLGRS